jgi:hypothetical protein
MKLLFAVVAFVLLLAGAHARGVDRLGQAVYLEGGVAVSRDGDELDPAVVTVGMDIENFDLIRTADDGTAQIQVTDGRAPRTTVTVSPNTQFSIEIGRIKNRQNSAVNLAAGSVSLKVSKLGAAQDLSVHTESAAMAVRGTDFTVTATEAGDILVTCDDGAVVCTQEEGPEVLSQPGMALQSIEGGGLRPVAVSGGDVSAFRRKWAEERRAAAAANAPRLIPAYARRYLLLLSAFERDYALLMAQRKVLDTWRAEDRAGRRGRLADAAREKRAIQAILGRIRATVFRLERVEVRLLRLKRLHDQGIGRGTVNSGLTTDRFYAEFSAQRVELERKLALVRLTARMYASRNGGEDPTARGPRYQRAGRD